MPKRRSPADAMLHRLLHRIADSAIAADDALAEGDGEALAEAVAGLARNTDFVVVLTLRWRPS